MAASISVSPQAWEDGYIHSLVTDSQGQLHTAWQWVQEEVWQDCWYWPGKSGWTSLEINQERGTLEAVMMFGLEVPDMFGIYMGELRTELSYDTEQRAIVRSDPSWYPWMKSWNDREGASSRGRFFLPFQMGAAERPWSLF